MKEILTVVCIYIGVLNYPGNNFMNYQDEPFNNSNTVAESGKRKSILTKEINSTFNYPNPFRSSTTILYNILSQGNVTITIFDLLGSEVCRYDEGFRDIGESEININLEYLNSGVYFYEIRVDGRRLAIKRLTLLK